MFCYGLDGDNIRSGLCSDLGFSKEDRDENIRRVTEVSKMWADGGGIAICSFVSPFKKHRDFPRQVHETADLAFFEVFVDTPLNECERRDTKGLYKKARAGELPGFTGIGQPYERPDNPELVVRTVREEAEAVKSVPVGECVQKVLDMLAAGDIVTETVAKQARSWFKQKEAAAAAAYKGDGRSNDARDTFDQIVPELFVSEERRESMELESRELPAVEIDTIDMQWLQVD